MTLSRFRTTALRHFFSFSFRPLLSAEIDQQHTRQRRGESPNFPSERSRPSCGSLRAFGGRSRALAPRGFSLIELLVVVALIGLLAVIALPAYNNYTLKSRFSEVIVATNPTKTAIATCVSAGDCVANGGVFLGSMSPTTDITYTTAVTANNTSLAAIYATAYAIRVVVSHDTPAQAASTAEAFVQNQIKAAPSYYAVVSTTADGSKTCLISYAQYTAANPTQCSSNVPTLAQVDQYMNADINPYFYTAVATVGGNATQDFPCVGTAQQGCTPPTKYTAQVSYDVNGVVTATATSNLGLNQETFTLTPRYSSGRIDWISSGSCKTRAGGSLC